MEGVQAVPKSTGFLGALLDKLPTNVTNAPETSNCSFTPPPAYPEHISELAPPAPETSICSFTPPPAYPEHISELAPPAPESFKCSFSLLPPPPYAPETYALTPAYPEDNLYKLSNFSEWNDPIIYMDL